MDDSRHDAPPTQGTLPPETSSEGRDPGDQHDLPRPFSEHPKQLSGQGCGKLALFGCGGLTLLFGIAMILLALNVNDVMAWMMDKFEAQVVLALPDDLPRDERDRLAAAFDDLQRALAAGEIDHSAMADFQRQMMDISESLNEGLTREQVRELTLALERVAGKEEGEPPPANGPPAGSDEE